MSNQLHNKTGTDAYNAVCNLERVRNAEPCPSMTRWQIVRAALIWMLIMAFTLWLCTDDGMHFLSMAWGIES